MTALTVLKMTILVILLIAAAGWDLATRRIPNFLTMTAVVLGLALSSLTQGQAGFLAWLSGTALGLGLLFIPYSMGGMGAGDVKFLAAIGALMGPRFVFCAFLYGAIVGGAISLVVLARAGRLARTMRTLVWNLAALFAPRLPFTPLPKLADAESDAARTSHRPDAFPYGVAIALGALAAMLVG